MTCTGDTKLNDPKVGREDRRPEGALPGEPAADRHHRRAGDDDRQGRQPGARQAGALLHRRRPGGGPGQGGGGESGPRHPDPAVGEAAEAREAASTNREITDDDRAVERKDRGGAEARDGQPAQGLPRPGRGAGRVDRGRPGGDRRAAGAQRRGQDDHLLHGGRADAARRRATSCSATRTSPSCRCTCARSAASAICRRSRRSSAGCRSRTICGRSSRRWTSRTRSRSGASTSCIDDFGTRRKVARNRGCSASGGERRRVEIARALVINPGIHPSGRAVRRDRPDRRARHPGHRRGT